MRTITITLLILFPVLSFSQNVGIGTTTPQEKLQVNGAININTTTNALPGTIRFNTANNDFEGFDGTQWKSLTVKGSSMAMQIDTGFNQQENDNFGYAVSLHENYLFVGAPGATVGANPEQGYVVIYKKNDFSNKYEKEQVITAPDGMAGDRFGSVIDGKLSLSAGAVRENYYIVIGAPKKKVAGFSNAGGVYFFGRDFQTGLFRIMTGGIYSPPDVAENDQFGASIIRTDLLLGYCVGSPKKKVNGAEGQGRVYYCEVSGFPVGNPDRGYMGNFQQIAIIDPPYAVPDGRFGTSLAVAKCDWMRHQVTNNICPNNEYYLFIGAPGANGSVTGQGKVFCYLAPNIYDTAIIASDPEINDNFGATLAVDRRPNAIDPNYPFRRLYIGAPNKKVGSNLQQGTVYVLIDTSTIVTGVAYRWWKQKTTLTVAEGLAGDQFGYDLKAYGNYLVAGSHTRNESQPGAGAVYIFEQQEGESNFSYPLRRKIIDPLGQENNFAGKTMDLLNTVFVIGVPNWKNGGRDKAGKIIFGDIY